MSLVLLATTSKLALIASEGRAIDIDGNPICEKFSKQLALDENILVGGAGRCDSLTATFRACRKAYAESDNKLAAVKQAVQDNWTPEPASNGSRFGAFAVYKLDNSMNVFLLNHDGPQDCRLFQADHYLLLTLAPGKRIRQLVEMTLTEPLEQARQLPPSQFVLSLLPKIQKVFHQAAQLDDRINTNLQFSTVGFASAVATTR